MNIFQQTYNEVATMAKKHKSVLVSFSGGKDSLVVLDICLRHFRKVVCFFMYFIPGLRCIEEQFNIIKQRYADYDFEILQYPHWLLFQCLKYMIYCDEYKIIGSDLLPDIKLKDIYRQVRLDTGINLIATGAKKADSLWRRRYMSAIGNEYKTFNPIEEWNKFDVLAYLKINKIPYPETTSGPKASGIDLSTPSLLWLHDNYPDDFQKLLSYFPYAEAVIKRREYYGIG